MVVRLQLHYKGNSPDKVTAPGLADHEHVLYATYLYINAFHWGKNHIEEAIWSNTPMAITYSRSLGDSWCQQHLLKCSLSQETSGALRDACAFQRIAQPNTTFAWLQLHPVSDTTLCQRYQYLYDHDPGTSSSSANQCVVGDMYLGSNLSRKQWVGFWALM